MSYPKLVIVSSGEKTAILLDGKMMSEGIENVEFLAEGATTTLNITGIDVARFSFGGPEDFKSFCEATGGHFVVVWWEDGKIRINDPASTKTARLNGDPKTFFSQAKYYWWVDARAFNNAPASAPAAPEGQVKRIHTVKRGDTLGAIARASNSTVSILAETNAIDNPNLIHVGQVIMLEKTAGAAAEKLATLGVIAAMTYWSRTAETVPWLTELLLGSARKVTKAGSRTTTAEEGIAALVSAGVMNTPDYWRELLKQKKVANLDDLMCALGGALK